ncbi:hypothetical protein [Brevibacillus centrosporus]|uniref:hypothetical protein n=1 Tax=Brevibacillus centrosporus TaxID=54910 RepID=UPI003B013F62
MNKIVSRSLVLVLFVWMLIIPSAKADVENGWYITGFSHDKPVQAQSESVFYVGVVDAKTKSGQMGALESTSPVTSALVTAIFSKGQEKKEVTLTYISNGEYKGTVLLPESGEWKVDIKATDNHHDTEFSTPIKVQDQEFNWTTILMVFLGVATSVVIILIYQSRAK